MPSDLVNKAVPGAKEFYPLNEPEIGTPWDSVGYSYTATAIWLTVAPGCREPSAVQAPDY